ncbi:Mini-ribonuclease 3 [Dethiobacter alkaliphilus]|uniref:Mini-ribonuclease 3 n=1 Tax=Dethiobacter alkaliphilus AHT 1 TaxID=555088 RepID=C0GIM8_DETAL|nr:ribonuclease III domain-containing protein [Dethiobacter alkaliphilus]EEG76889.1 ribonuclease III [Dethiobacter alkaliphilus AHT 1]
MNSNLSPLMLAYVGDAVFELFVRQKLSRQKALPVRQLHRRATRLVRAEGQDAALGQIEPLLSEEEAEIVRRGRNTKSRVPKNADMAAYRRATGFEALLGWLYLNGEHHRLEELLDAIEMGEES